jgi:hypothetical protein
MAARTAAFDLPLDVKPETLRWLNAHPDEAGLLERFVSMMADELAANNSKGNRPGWLEMDRKAAVAEVHWHASKLAVSAKSASLEMSVADPPERGTYIERRRADTCEYAADVANCALILLDCMGLILPPSQPREAK